MSTLTFDDALWQLVPIEPTQEMMEAGSNAQEYAHDDIYPNEAVPWRSWTVSTAALGVPARPHIRRRPERVARKMTESVFRFAPCTMTPPARIARHSCRARIETHNGNNHELRGRHLVVNGPYAWSVVAKVGPRGFKQKQLKQARMHAPVACLPLLPSPE